MVPSIKQSATQDGSPIRAAFTEIVSFVFIFSFLIFSLMTENPVFSLVQSPLIVVNLFMVLNSLLQITLFLVIYPTLNPQAGMRDYPVSKKKQGAQQILKTVVKSVAAFVGFWAVAHFFAVIFGAPLLEDAEKTSVWAGLVSSLIIVPGVCIIGPKPRKWVALFNLMNFDSSQKRTLFYCTVLTIIGSWASAVVIPLDWDRPWQLWPTPGVVGAMLGYCVGLLIGGAKIVKDIKFSKVH